ncbi:hypothetical protein ACIBCN_41265 [Nocardia sp. NPDC051052]|uniref:hypothetical protein n=1 Tax=Nocardia sp. NPDC051052 TaxID=3364322 RepID=UPI00379EF545
MAAEVLPEIDVSPVPSDIRLFHVFGVDGHDDLGIRRSRLRDDTAAVVSENIVTFRLRDRDLLIPKGDIPFGLHTRNLGLLERRQILVAGVTTDSFGLLPTGSPGRIYEIEFSNRARVLVHEVFNPWFVSAGQDRREQLSQTRKSPGSPGWFTKRCGEGPGPGMHPTIKSKST